MRTLAERQVRKSKLRSPLNLTHSFHEPPHFLSQRGRRSRRWSAGWRLCRLGHGCGMWGCGTAQRQPAQVFMSSLCPAALTCTSVTPLRRPSNGSFLETWEACLSKSGTSKTWNLRQNQAWSMAFSSTRCLTEMAAATFSRGGVRQGLFRLLVRANVASPPHAHPGRALRGSGCSAGVHSETFAFSRSRAA